MALDISVVQQFQQDLKNLRKRYDRSERDQWGWHAFGRRALVIYADRSTEAAYSQTPENLAKARSALADAEAVFDTLDKFVNNQCTKADIGDHLMRLEDNYLRDFPHSRLSDEIRSGRYPI